jgi:hypothetical protein
MTGDSDTGSDNPSPRPPALGEAERYEVERAADFAWHKNAGTMGLYYQLYPLDRPVDWGVEPQDLPPETRRRLGMSIEGEKPEAGRKPLTFHEQRYPEIARDHGRDR